MIIQIVRKKRNCYGVPKWPEAGTIFCFFTLCLNIHFQQYCVVVNIFTGPWNLTQLVPLFTLGTLLLCISPLNRGGILWLPLAGRCFAALDRLSEKQGHQGGALAHPNQRAAGLHPAGVNWASILVLTLKEKHLKSRTGGRFTACSWDFLHDFDGFIPCLLCLSTESSIPICTLMFDLEGPDLRYSDIHVSWENLMAE